jgi:hypothetical protein
LNDQGFQSGLLVSSLAVGTPLLSLPLAPAAAQTLQAVGDDVARRARAIAPREELLLDFGQGFKGGWYGTENATVFLRRFFEALLYRVWLLLRRR